MTAAHKTLPMNTMLLIKNLDNGKQTLSESMTEALYQGRIVDLSLRQPKSIGIADKGIARVQAMPWAEEEHQPNIENHQPLVYQELSTGEFYVQIGAFSEKASAAKLQKRFAEAGHMTIIQRNFDRNQCAYMVQVYAGKTIQNAKRAEKALLESGYSGAFVIAR